MRDMPRDTVPLVDWASQQLSGEGVSITSLFGLTQHVVSGDLEAFSARHGTSSPVGLLGNVTGTRYAVRTARDRMIAIGVPDADVSVGWNDDGYAVTRISSALHVLEISGPNAMAIVSRACASDPASPGASVAVLFAGISAYLYRHDETMRLHVDRALAPYLWSWMRAQSLFAKGE